NRLRLSMWFEELPGNIEIFDNHKHYVELERYSNSLMGKVLPSPYPIVCTAPIQTDAVNLFSALMDFSDRIQQQKAETKLVGTLAAHLLSAPVILYNDDPQVDLRYKMTFGPAAALSGGRLRIVNSIEGIFQ